MSIIIILLCTDNGREIGALVVLFMSARFFEGAIQVPDVKTMIIRQLVLMLVLNEFIE